MLGNIRGLSSWCCKDYVEQSTNSEKQRIVKQDESDGDPEFTVTIRLGGKLTSYWKTIKRQFWKWKRTCKVY
jgi:hypothetical protein